MNTTHRASFFSYALLAAIALIHCGSNDDEPAGVAGSAGTTAGASGTSGTAGTGATSGTSGSGGTNGTGGTGGTGGSSGTAGSGGTAGNSGTGGSSGTSGTSGTGGTAGAGGTGGSGLCQPGAVCVDGTDLSACNTAVDCCVQETICRQGEVATGTSCFHVAGGGAGGACPGDTCLDRTGGALITFAIGGDTANFTEYFTAWIQNGAFIDQAITLVGAEASPVPVFGTLIVGADCDSQWGWHVDPNDVSFADFTIELCDARFSYIQSDIQGWIDSVGQHCPWSAKVYAVDDLR